MPCPAASADRLSACSKVAPSASAAFNASRPGIRASIIVLSAGSALPRAWTPVIAASSAAAQSSEPSSVRPARTVPICRNSVPYRGPPAPPTVDTSVMPAVFSRAPMSCSSPASSTLTSTADIPRSMLIPWSPSPIAASSAVSCCLFASTSTANARIQRTTSSWPRLMRPDAFSLSATSTILCLCRPSETGGLDRRVPEAGQLVVQLQQRDRAARHLQRRDVGPDQVAGDRDSTLAQEPVQVVVGDVELDQRRAAHAVDEREYLVALLERQVLDDRGGELLDDLGRGCALHPPAAGLTVDADADLHLVVAELEGRLPGRGHDARGQRHAHAAAVGVHLSAQLRHLG